MKERTLESDWQEKGWNYAVELFWENEENVCHSAVEWCDSSRVCCAKYVQNIEVRDSEFKERKFLNNWSFIFQGKLR